MEKRTLEREQIVEALKKSGGKVIHAAKLLGMSRNTLAQRMKAHGILRESFKV
jgi:transcriptional regulator of acetoin/glycerol metabolism